MTSTTDEIANLRAALDHIRAWCGHELKHVPNHPAKTQLEAVCDMAKRGLKTQRASVTREVPVVTKERYDEMRDHSLRLMCRMDDLGEAMALGIETHLVDMYARDVPELAGPLAAWRVMRPTPGLAGEPPIP